MASLSTRLLLLGLALLATITDSKSFRVFRSFRSVAGGGDSLAAGTGALVGFGNVDFGRAGLASGDVLSGGVDGGGDFESAIELVSGKRGKIGSTAESAILLSKDGLNERLLERGSFSLNDGQLKSRLLKDLLYKEKDSASENAQAASIAKGGERIKANDTAGFRNTYHLDESGTKSTFSDKYRQGVKYKEAAKQNNQRSSDEGRKTLAARLDAVLKAEQAKENGAFLTAKNKENKEERLIKAGLKKYLKDGQREERKKVRRRLLKKGDDGVVGDLNDGSDVIYYDDDDDYEDELEIDENRQYVV